MARGELHVYLGAAPGVGKTYTMLREARRLRSRGTDVVVGIVEAHGRTQVERLADELEVVAPRMLEAHTELDLDAVLARAPDVVVIDDLAHTNPAGSRNARRWQDVWDLLDAGSTVLSTVDVGQLDSMTDVVASITGGGARATVPDELVRRADRVELVDAAPEALRARLEQGEVYPPERIDAAVDDHFRIGNLTALRELALLWLADQVDERLAAYRSEHGIDEAWQARERIVVALAGGPEGEALIRRGARLAARGKGADLLAVHVTRSNDLSDSDPALLAKHRLLVEGLGGTYHQVVGRDVATALLDFARAKGATQLVIGASRRSRVARAVAPGVGAAVTSRSGPIDVHLVTHAENGRSTAPTPMPSALSRSRKIWGFALAAIGLPLVTATLQQFRNEIHLPTDVLVMLAAVIAATLVGGRWPALVAAVGGFGLLNFFFTEPYHTFVIADVDEIAALVIFLVVAVAISVLVDIAARRAREAARASADAHLLATVAGSVLGGTSPLVALLERLRETFGLDAVTVL